MEKIIQRYLTLSRLYSVLKYSQHIFSVLSNRTRNYLQHLIMLKVNNFKVIALSTLKIH